MLRKIAFVGATLTSCSVAFAASAERAKGFADTHLHQMADQAWGGGFIWGHHDGPQSKALARCSGQNDHGFLLGEGTLGLHLKRRDGFPTFEGWPRWDAVSHQTVHADWLKRAHERGLTLVVMSAGNDEPFCEAIPKKHRKAEWGCDDMAAVDRMLTAAHDFAREHSWYEIALTPKDARRIVAEGKLAVVLSIEVGELFGKRDFVQELDRYHKRGVRTMGLTHLLNSRFSGTAVMPRNSAVFEMLERIENGKVAYPIKRDEHGFNSQGLSAEGKKLISAMMQRHMLVDTAHMSHRAFNDTYALAQGNHFYPLYRSHGYLKEIMLPKNQDADERLAPASVVQKIKKTGGTFGLRTGAEEMLTYKKSGVANNCHGSSRSFAQQYQLASIGMKVPVTFGSDLNGLIAQMAPRFGDPKEACHDAYDFEREGQQRAQGSVSKQGIGTEFDTKGFARVDLMADVIVDLKKLGVDTSNIESSTEAFISMWERAHDESRKALSDEVDVTGVEPYDTKKERKKAHHHDHE